MYYPESFAITHAFHVLYGTIPDNNLMSGMIVSQFRSPYYLKKRRGNANCAIGFLPDRMFGVRFTST